MTDLDLTAILQRVTRGVSVDDGHIYRVPAKDLAGNQADALALLHEVDRLRSIITGAPHQLNCRTLWSIPRHCDCWKAKETGR